MWPLFRNVRLKYECSFHRIPRSQLRVAVIRRVLGRSIGRPPLLDNSSRTSLPISGSRNGTRSEMVVACGKARQHRCLLRHWCQAPRVGAFISSVGVQTRAGRAPSSFNVDVANVSWNTRRVGPPTGFPYARSRPCSDSVSARTGSPRMRRHEHRTMTGSCSTPGAQSLLRVHARAISPTRVLPAPFNISGDHR